jgi:tRNA(adenine34) deaminase
MLQNNMENHNLTMRIAIDQAILAGKSEEVPIGAVIVERATGKLVAMAGNRTIAQNDPSAHAEILAIRAACAHFGAQRIPQCDLYVTLEPCPMCAAAISFARIGHVYFGAEDAKSGGFVNGPALASHAALHHKAGFTGGILADECAALLRDFFKARR